MTETIQLLLVSYGHSIQNELTGELFLLDSMETIRKQERLIQTLWKKVQKPVHNFQELLEFVRGFHFGDGKVRSRLLHQLILFRELNGDCQELAVNLQQMIQSRLITDLEVCTAKIRWWKENRIVQKERPERQLYVPNDQYDMLSQLEFVKKQEELLWQKVHKKLQSLEKQINLLTEEIANLKNGERKDFKKLRETQEKLRKEMITQMILVCIESVIQITNTYSIVEQGLSGFLNADHSILARTESDLKEFRGEGKEQLLEIRLELAYIPFILNDTACADRIKAIDEITGLSIGLKPEQESDFSRIREKIRQAFHTKIYFLPERMSSVSEDDYYEITKKIHTEVIRIMENNYAKQENQDKREAFRKTAEILKQHQAKEMIHKATGFCHTTCSFLYKSIRCETGCFDVRSSFEQKRDILKGIISRKHQEMKSFDKLVYAVVTRKREILEQRLMPFIKRFKGVIRDQDIYMDQIAGLNIREDLKYFIQSFDDIRLIQVSGAGCLVEHLNKLLRLELVIADNIVRKRDRLSLGNLAAKMAETEDKREPIQKKDSYFIRKAMMGSLYNGKKASFKNTFSYYRLHEEETRRFLTGEMISFPIPVNPQLNGMKCETIYVHIPELMHSVEAYGQQPKRININAHFYGAGSCMIRDGEGANERCYQFSQESLDLVHSLDVRHHLANNSDSVSIGYPLTNDSEDCKFKQTGLAAGRSPFSMVSLSLSGVYDKRLKFEYLTTKEKEKLGEYYQMNPRMAWDRMMVDWKQKGWISQSGELLKTWSEMKEKLEKRKHLVGLDQWRDTMTFLESGLWMDILYRQMSITGEDISHLTVEFVGSACYVTSDFLKVQGHHPACYEPYCVG